VPQLTRNPSIEGFSEAGKGRRTRSSNVRGVRPLVCPRVVVQTEWYRVENWSYQGCSENPWNGGVATWRAKLCAHLCTRTEFRLLPQAVEVYCPTLIAVERSPTSGLTQNYRSLDTQDLSDKPCLYWQNPCHGGVTAERLEPRLPIFHSAAHQSIRHIALPLTMSTSSEGPSRPTHASLSGSISGIAPIHEHSLNSSMVEGYQNSSDAALYGPNRSTSPTHGKSHSVQSFVPMLAWSERYRILTWPPPSLPGEAG
jgi:hypothetical protein